MGVRTVQSPGIRQASCFGKDQMNPKTIILVAKHAQHVLDLAAKEATRLEDWRHISALAAQINYLLHSIEQSDWMREDLRKQAKELTHWLLGSMRESCNQVEALGGFDGKEEL